VVQAQELEKVLLERKLKIKCVINLEVSEEVLVKRLSGRRVCLKCGANYNIYFSQNLEKCTRCGSALSRREDDREEVIRKRLALYTHLTKPLVDYYAKQGQLKVVKADTAPTEIYQKIKEIIGSL
jgi:adenylate kinase